MTELLLIISGILFVSSGLGYIIFNYILLITLELFKMLFNGFVGFIMLGLFLSYCIQSFH